MRCKISSVKNLRFGDFSLSDFLCTVHKCNATAVNEQPKMFSIIWYYIFLMKSDSKTTAAKPMWLTQDVNLILTVCEWWIKLNLHEVNTIKCFLVVAEDKLIMSSPPIFLSFQTCCRRRCRQVSWLFLMNNQVEATLESLWGFCVYFMEISSMCASPSKLLQTESKQWFSVGLKEAEETLYSAWNKCKFTTKKTAHNQQQRHSWF